jgi:signal transduction histidine kinase
MRLRLRTGMNIGTRVRAYLACILGIVLGVGVFGFVANARATSDLRSSLADGFELNSAVDELRLLSSQARLIISAAAAAGTTTDLREVDDTAAKFVVIANRIEAKLPPRFAPSELRQMMTAVAGIGRDFVEANARQQWARAADLSSRFDQSAETLRERLQRMDDEQKAQVAAKLATAAVELRKRNAYFAAGFALCIALGVILTWSLQKRLVDPLAVLTAATSRVVESGDLSIDFKEGGDDELGALSRSLGLMLRRLRENIDTLRRNEAALRHESAERQQMQKKLVLADRMASMGTLAAGIAHEINNPLAYTLANLSYVSDCLRAFPTEGAGIDLIELRAAAAEAFEGAERVRGIVKDMKSLSRVDDDRIGAVDIERALETSVNMAAQELRHKARVVKEFGGVGLALANEGHLVQVFLNLLINASQAISTSDPENNEVRIATCFDGNDRVVIEVCDTGGGIPEDVLPRIFDPFFTTKPIGVGTGLGLSICHGLLAAMGGQIEVASKVGVGTRFLVTLPVARAAEAVPSALAAA